MTVWQRVLFYVVTGCCVISNGYAVSIIVHGTFAAKESWYKPGSDFCNALCATKSDTSAASLVPFTWSGELTHAARVDGAQRLAELIVQYNGQPLTLIGHSHGANVINLASNLLALARHSMEGENTILQSIDSMVQLFVTVPNLSDNQVNNMSHTRAATTGVAESPEELREQIIAAVGHIKQKMIFLAASHRAVRKKYLIDLVQLLAVPILTEGYAPNMNMIKRVENYYSQEDWIQVLAGSQTHVYPSHTRMIQARVCFAASPKTRIFEDPDHSGLHDPLVGRWLSQMQTVLDTKWLGKHVAMVLYRDGTLPFVQEYKIGNTRFTLENHDPITV